MAHYPDSNFIYSSYAHSLAKKQTQTIRQIITLPYYKKLFGVEISSESSAKDNFETNKGGSVFAAGAGGPITGRGAGINGMNRPGGVFIIDDIHKPDEVTSDTMREGIIDWFFNTAQSRVNSPKTPFLFIGQRLHEYDLPAKLIELGWDLLSIPALDEAGNALHPTMHDRIKLKEMQETMPYVFASQYQQNPQPAGGGIFKPEWFYLTDNEPDIIDTFITADTAETSKEYNDATAFSFWGVYRIKQADIETDVLGIHWIDCVEIRVEPKDLKEEFLQFYADCMRFKVKPNLAIIEKKSTGSTLLSILNDMQGLQVLDVNRKGSPSQSFNNKTDRFLSTQPYVASKRISLPRYGKHTKMCIDHCRKITANQTHRFDDIADTLADAVKAALVDQIVSRGTNVGQNDIKARKIMGNFNRLERIRKNVWQK
jgi:hypothetical protein